MESWSDALYLIQGKRIFLGLFAAHLAVEKVIKAHIVKETKNIPPFMHNLNKLAELANIRLTDRQKDVLADLTSYNIRGRYQETLGSPPPIPEVKALMRRSKEMFEWLLKTL